MSKPVEQKDSSKNTKGLSKAIISEIEIVNKFPNTYRSREDITNLPPGVLVVGSQNILSNVSERLEVRKGYTLDGVLNTLINVPTPVSYYKLNANSTDSLGVNNGTDTAISYATAGVIGNCATFNGTTSKITMVSSASLNPNEITLSAWIKPTAAGTLPIFGEATSFSGCLVFILVQSSGTLFISKSYVGSIAFSDSGSIPLNMWSHVAMSYNQTTGAYAFYLNGQAYGSGTATPTALTTRAMAIGFSDPVYWTGGIDELAIFSSALSAEAVANLYNNGLGFPYPFANTSIGASIVSSFDWNSKGNSEIHMRAGFLTSAANDGKLQFRYLDTAGAAQWQTLIGSLTTVNYNFTTFWDTTELIRLCLFVNGTSNIFEWNGAYDKVASITTNTIVMTNTIATSGFYSTRNKVVTINGIDYTYTGISSKTFTGVTPDPTGNVAAGALTYQKVVTTANSAFTAGGNKPPDTFANGLISTLNNQVFLGSLTSSTFYMSKGGSFVDYNFSALRIPYEGGGGTLDDNLVAFMPQEDVMYISAGKSFWYNTSLEKSASFNGTVAITAEAFTVKLLKTNPRQGAQSQGLVGKMKNNIIVVTNEPTFDMMGRVESILGTPQTTNISDSIKNDFDTYDFTGGHVFYWRYYLLVSVPREGIIRIYSLATNSWEAPQTIPITRFYTVDGELYGHSYASSESYKLFDGYSDRATATVKGNPYLVVANFSYQNFGVRTVLKNQNKFYIEGYISGNTTLNCVINYEQDGNLTQQTFQILGDDTTFIGSGDQTNSLGKYPLGSQPLGSNLATSLTGLPPKFRAIKTFPRFDFYECQFSFSILGVDQNFQLLAFGTNAAPSATQNYAIEE